MEGEEAAGWASEAEVQSIVESVNGTFAGAGANVRTFLDRNRRLTDAQLLRILRAYNLVGNNRDSEAYVHEHNLVVPTYGNQLNGHGGPEWGRFYERYVIPLLQDVINKADPTST